MFELESPEGEKFYLRLSWIKAVRLVGGGENLTIRTEDESYWYAKNKKFPLFIGKNAQSSSTADTLIEAIEKDHKMSLYRSYP